MNAKLTAERLHRRALVYIRQSSPTQVAHNQESQRRQYGLADRARELGFSDVITIDDDLGRSGSGLIERPGFQRLVAEICTGEVGAVLSLEASRLARNGRDWHHLIELCGMVGTVVIDHDGIYDPALLNDRLLLGLKGTMSEFELSLLRQRSQEAIQQKARRGELRLLLPVGLCWTSSGRIELDPDRRVQQAIQLVFTKMTELGSARQVLLWFRRERMPLPAVPRSPGEPTLVWKPPVYHSILAMLTNPMYAGAYAFGKTEVRTRIIEGRVRKTIGHRKPSSAWSVLIRDHHPAYISWAQYERHQAVIAANTHMKSRMERKAGRGGRALLSGLLRCRRCGRMLHVVYGGHRGEAPRYHCRGAHINHGVEGKCISFGSLRVDDAVANEVLHVIGGNAVDAALEAADQLRRQRDDRRAALALEVDQARYEVRLAERRYEAVDPENRLIAAELEARWNSALQHAHDVRDRLDAFDRDVTTPVIPDRAVLLSLAQDLPAVWYAPTTEMRLKQRIIRVVIQEIVVDVDEPARTIVLVIHWVGGRHSELRVKKNEPGQHRRRTSLEAIDVIRRMAGQFPDEQIAATLNRLGLKTGNGNTWTEIRVRSARNYHALPAYNPSGPRNGLTLQEAAHYLGVSPTTVRRLIRNQYVTARQVVPCAPWEIARDGLDSESVREAIRQIQARVRLPRTHHADEQPSMFSSEREV
jgi:DNA invertase Pin-like site-specific DNA recombinase